MIWSKQELENLALGGAEVTRERVMKHLSAPENADIFAAENFSYLWGALGVAGAKGLDAATCRKIWQALCDNGAADAFDKGILGDYNRALAAESLSGGGRSSGRSSGNVSSTPSHMANTVRPTSFILTSSSDRTLTSPPSQGIQKRLPVSSGTILGKKI